MRMLLNNKIECISECEYICTGQMRQVHVHLSNNLSSSWLRKTLLHALSGQAAS